MKLLITFNTSFVKKIIQSASDKFNNKRIEQ